LGSGAKLGLSIWPLCERGGPKPSPVGTT